MTAEELIAEANAMMDKHVQALNDWNKTFMEDMTVFAEKVQSSDLSVDLQNAILALITRRMVEFEQLG